MERRTNSTSHAIAGYLKNKLQSEGSEVSVFNLSEASIPFFDITLSTIPIAAQVMAEEFRSADLHIWLTPLYHGSMTGIMKNCLDWLEISAKETAPYLTDKVVGLVCWADGGQAMQGITAMDAVAKSLRAWTLPYSIPAVRSHLYDHAGNLSKEYQMKFDRMTNLLLATGNTLLT